MVNKKDWKVVCISKKNYDVLNNLGKTNDTFNSVLSRIFEENNLYVIVTEGNETKQ
jgi:hypothetical protein